MIETIQGCTLLPLPIDWDAGTADYSYQWPGDLAAAVRGAESRGVMSVHPQVTLTFPWICGERQTEALVARLRRALKSGRACVPAAGRASFLRSASTAGSLTLALAPGAWDWSLGASPVPVLVWSADMLRHGVGWVSGYSAGSGAGPTIDLNWVGFPQYEASGILLTEDLPAGALVYPLLFGRAEIDEAELLTADTSDGSIRLIMDGGPVKWLGSSGAPTYDSRPLWAWSWDVSETPRRSLSFDPRPQRIGFGNEVLESLQEHLTQGFDLAADFDTLAQAHAMESYVAEQRGRLAPWWLPSPARGVELVDQTAADTVRIIAQDLAETWDEAPSRDLQFRPNSGEPGTAFGARISSVLAIGGGMERIVFTHDLAEAVNPRWDAAWLHLCRFAEEEVTISFEGEGRGALRVAARELPLEVGGSELGLRPALLYRFKRTVAGTTTVWRFTSLDVAVVVPGDGTYAPAPVEHGEIEQSLDGESQAEISTWRFEGSPLLAWDPMPPPWSLGVEIRELMLSGPDATIRTLFAGRVGEVRLEGKKITAKLATRLDALGANVPWPRVQKRCNKRVYGPGCKAVRSAFERDGTVVATDTLGHVLRVSIPGTESLATDWWLHGLIVSGDEEQTIVACARVTGETIQWDVRLLAPFRQLPAAAAAVALSPGCALTPEHCGPAKFNNYINFGGHPKIDGNLSLKAMDVQAASGGKK